MNAVVKFIKGWTLPIAMAIGIFAYFLFSRCEATYPLKPFIFSFVKIIMPLLIFVQLLLTFCKINPKDLNIKKWHVLLLLFQLLSCLLFASLLIFWHFNDIYTEVFEGAMVCLICPTATAAAIITAKLGGSAASLTTYTLLSNILVAVVVPMIFPLIEPHEHLSFIDASTRILYKVLPLLVSPFVIALALRRFLPSLHRFLSSLSGLAFYIWAIALAIVCGQTVHSMMNSKASWDVQCLIAFGALVACILQFFVGKSIGGKYRERISGGQALGQKNTVLAIWMAYTYLNPLSSLAPGTYVLWQNIINSWQLWRMDKKIEAKNNPHLNNDTK